MPAAVGRGPCSETHHESASTTPRLHTGHRPASHPRPRHSDPDPDRGTRPEPGAGLRTYRIAGHHTQHSYLPTAEDHVPTPHDQKTFRAEPHPPERVCTGWKP